MLTYLRATHDHWTETAQYAFGCITQSRSLPPVLIGKDAPKAARHDAAEAEQHWQKQHEEAAVIHHVFQGFPDDERVKEDQRSECWRL